MKYMLLIYGDEKALTQTEREQCYEESVAFTHKLKANGKFLGASPLRSVSEAVSVHVRNGQSTVTDGPFAETHEQLGGYFLVDVQNRDEAVDIAREIPGAKFGTVEVRPVMELEGLPEGAVR